MEKKRIDAAEHLNVFQLSDGEKIKRYEIFPDNGYEFYRKSEDVSETGTVFFPASWGIEKILADITVREN